MGKKAVGSLFSDFLIVATVIQLLLGVAGWRASYIDPSESGWAVLLGLGLPLILIVNFGLLVYWVVRCKVWLLLPLAALLLNTDYITSMYQLPLGSPEPKPVELKIASYNVHAFHGPDAGYGLRETVSEMADFFRGEGADVLCLEEFVTAKGFELDSIMRIFSDWPHVATGGGITIFSKCPIADVEVIPFSDTDNSALWVDLLVQERRVRVLTAHLQTTGVDPVKRELNRQNGVGSSTDVAERIWMGYRVNSTIRAQQVKRLRQMLDTVTMPVIVCGDFNDTPSSYTYRAMKGGLTDAFKSCGSGYGATFRNMKGLLRIDYLFYNDHFEGIRYYAAEVPYSDHRPILLELAFKP